jgi:hypothetical protein
LILLDKLRVAKGADRGSLRTTFDQLPPDCHRYVFIAFTLSCGEPFADETT